MSSKLHGKNTPRAGRPASTRPGSSSAGTPPGSPRIAIADRKRQISETQERSALHHVELELQEHLIWSVRTATLPERGDEELRQTQRAESETDPKAETGRFVLTSDYIDHAASNGQRYRHKQAEHSEAAAVRVLTGTFKPLN